MSSASRADQCVLGLDIGPNSIGWALVAAENERPSGLVAAGVRVFDAGVEGDIQSGRDASRGVARREARSRRRQLERRRRRLNRLAHVLQAAGLLPPGKVEAPADLLVFFDQLDRDLFPAHPAGTEAHVQLYRLRARALDEKMQPYEIGRAIYHLAQRRGFKSNKLVRAALAAEEEKEDGKVKDAIKHLAQDMRESGARTLGEYLSSLDPSEQRIRGRWLGRAMLEEEFAQIWTGQVAHYPELLTEDLRRRIYEVIFFQRPLKLQRHLIGHCDLERGRQRARLCLLAAQRFRLLQKVNDLEVITPQGEILGLTPAQRATLLDVLESQGDLKFGAVRKLVGLSRYHKFNLEREGDDRIIGNRTAAKLARVFGPRWASLSGAERDRVVDDVRSITKTAALVRRGKNAWGLDDDAAGQLAEVTLEAGYCNLSRQALAKVLPLMEGGMQYATARKQVYGEAPSPEPHDRVPPLRDEVEPRNPAVERALSETRRVVNAVVARYGKPGRIRIELARDLRKNRKQRQAIHQRNRDNQSAREQAAKAIIQRAGIPRPTRRDIQKYLLAQECGWRCPYTGREIAFEALFGDSPQFDIEHIIPFHRCFDDSFFNKTLCEVNFNRQVKRDRTPWEACADTPNWPAILERVGNFIGDARAEKLKKFKLTTAELETIDDFASRQLNDTRYASRLARQFLGALYGAGAMGVDPQGKLRLEAARGQVTSVLRNAWKLNVILGGGEKTRDDHRQHAIDAVVVALTDPATVKRLSDASARDYLHRGAARMEAPWTGFLDEVREAIESMVVSHRLSRPIKAALHQETHYSKVHPDRDGKPHVHVRKPLEKLSQHEVGAIVDPAVAVAVRAKLDELGIKDPSQAFKRRDNHPALKAKDGRDILIHKARIRVAQSVACVGAGPRERRVALASNHHIEIIETTDRKGAPRWQGVVVSTFEAARRLRDGEPIVQRDHGEGKRFLFSLAGGDIIELDVEEKDKTGSEGDGPKRGLFVIRTVSQGAQGRIELDFAGINDARPKKAIQACRDWGRSPVSRLQQRNCRKVVVTPLGEVRRAND
jgi:CRISPR-associated endonuclease Csn1